MHGSPIRQYLRKHRQWVDAEIAAATGIPPVRRTLVPLGIVRAQHAPYWQAAFGDGGTPPGGWTKRKVDL